MRLFRTARRAGTIAVLPWVLVAWLSGCGAGVVGTGTGTGDDGDIGYAEVGLCTAPFADASLTCSTLVKDPDRGTSRVQWIDGDKSTGGASVLAVPEVNGIALQIPCRQLNFAGRWGELGNGTLAFVGRYTAPDRPDGRPAFLTVEEDLNDPSVVGTLVLFDATGQALLGPWRVRRVEGEVQFAGCGS